MPFRFGGASGFATSWSIWYVWFVIQPVKFQSPAEVSGTGATSSLTYNVKTGYAGTLGYAIRGLQAAAKFDEHIGSDAACSFDTTNPDAMVAAGKATVSSFTTPAGSSLIRFQTFQEVFAADDFVRLRQNLGTRPANRVSVQAKLFQMFLHGVPA